MPGETSYNTQGSTVPSEEGTNIIIAPPPPENWWDVAGWYEYAQGQAIVKLVPPIGNLQQNTLEQATLARRKRQIAAKKARQVAWRAAQAKRNAAAAAKAKAAKQAAADQAEEDNLDYMRTLEIFTPDPFTKKLGKFNPPPHRASRSNSPIAFTGLDVVKNEDYNKIFDSEGIPYDNFEYKTIHGSGFEPVPQSSTELAARSFQRGLFYQDSDSATHLDGSIALGLEDLWGFQFMYNPQNIGIDTQVSTNIDYMNNQDIANQMAGTQIINFNLLLNRVFDVSVDYQDLYPRGTNPAKFDKKEYLTYAYGRVLSDEELAMIKARGTEYDLEFLYRVINGDPQSTPMLKNLASDKTSDFGYIAGIPIWLRFNNNVKYKGVITSINVKHVMFNAEMVPTMTEVGISFSRIPIIGYGTVEQRNKSILKTSNNSVYFKPTKVKKLD